MTLSTPAGVAWLRRLHDADRAGHAPADGSLRIEALPAGPDGSMAAVLARLQPPGPPVTPPSWRLTASEQRVVSLLVGGLTNCEISITLSISGNTVEFYPRHSYDKRYV